MAWGWWGALIGAGASVLFAPFTGGASLAAIPKFLLLAGAGAAIGAGVGKVAGSVLESSGDTPKNQLAAAGLNPEKLHEEAKEYREKRQEFLNKKNEEDLKAIKELDEKLDSLDESIKNLQVEVTNMDDSNPSKAGKVAQLNGLKNQRDNVQKERDSKQKNVDNRNEKIDSILKSLGDPVSYSTADYNQKANTPLWKSYKNWGIGIAAVIILLILIGFLKKLFSSLLSNLK